MCEHFAGLLCNTGNYARVQEAGIITHLIHLKCWYYVSIVLFTPQSIYGGTNEGQTKGLNKYNELWNMLVNAALPGLERIISEFRGSDEALTTQWDHLTFDH